MIYGLNNMMFVYKIKQKVLNSNAVLFITFFISV